MPEVVMQSRNWKENNIFLILQKKKIREKWLYIGLYQNLIYGNVFFPRYSSQRQSLAAGGSLTDGNLTMFN